MKNEDEKSLKSAEIGIACVLKINYFCNWPFGAASHKIYFQYFYGNKNISFRLVNNTETVG